ncbi:ribosomal protein S18-alanine N-acetyltransferase [bacterium]|nr:ribosomal protein S18-alanine N-acetyltransferase [bacterium]
MNGLVLDFLSDADLARVLEIEEASFSLPWSPAVFSDQIRMKQHSWCLCLRETAEEEVLGYAIFWLAVDEIHLMNIAVSPRHRQRGYGDLLLRAVMHLGRKLEAERIVLEVRVSNQVAIRLYEKYQFRTVVVRPRYYSDNNEDAYLMMQEPVMEPAGEDLFFNPRVLDRVQTALRRIYRA